MQNQKKKYFWIVFDAAFVLFMVKLDAFIVAVSLPTIARSFGLNAAEASYVVVAYLLLLTNTLLIFGKLEDRIGVKRLLIYGYLIFTAGSLFCGLSLTISALILSRAIQGIGGAMMLICGFGAVNTYLAAEIKGWGMGIVTTAAALGLATGAPLGGLITHFSSWRWIFLVNVPLGILGILISLKEFPKEEISKDALSSHFDYLGAILSFTGLSGLTYVLSTGEHTGWLSMHNIVLLAASVLILASFIFWETRCKYPLLELRIFRNRGFALGNIAVFIIFVILSGTDFIMPFFLDLAKGMKSYQIGLVMFLYSVSYSIFAPYAGRLSDKPERGSNISISATLIVSLIFFIYAFTLQVPAMAYTIGFFALWGIANSFIIPEGFRLVLVNTPADEKGVGSGVFNVFNNLSAVFGICVFQIIFSHKMQSIDIPAQDAIEKMGWSKEMLFVTFRNIFIFGGVLYALTAVFSVLAEGARFKDAGKTCPANSLK